MKEKTDNSYEEFRSIISSFGEYGVTECSLPSAELSSIATAKGFHIIKNDYVQFYPSDNHKLSKLLTS